MLSNSIIIMINIQNPSCSNPSVEPIYRRSNQRNKPCKRVVVYNGKDIFICLKISDLLKFNLNRNLNKNIENTKAKIGMKRSKDNLEYNLYSLTVNIKSINEPVQEKLSISEIVPNLCISLRSFLNKFTIIIKIREKIKNGKKAIYSLKKFRNNILTLNIMIIFHNE